MDKELAISDKIPYIPVSAAVMTEAEKEQFLKQLDRDWEIGSKDTIRMIDGIRMRQVAGQTLLIPTGRAAAAVRQAAVLNHEAARLVELMTGEFTVDSIVQKGLKIFRVDEDVLRSDVQKLIDTLGKAGILIGEGIKQPAQSGKIHTISGTAVVKDGKIISSKTTDIQKT